VRSTTFLFITQCTLVEKFWLKHSQIGAHQNEFKAERAHAPACARARPRRPSASAPHARLPKAASLLPNVSRPETPRAPRRFRTHRAGPPVRSLSPRARRPEATVPRRCPSLSPGASRPSLFKAATLPVVRACRTFVPGSAAGPPWTPPLDTSLCISPKPPHHPGAFSGPHRSSPLALSRCRGSTSPE
jgi:hypothetical protein